MSYILVQSHTTCISNDGINFRNAHGAVDGITLHPSVASCAQAFGSSSSIVFMAELVSQRKRHVQTLRSVAKICRLELIRDDSSQDRVRAFAAAIEASEAEESQKQKARDAFTAYLATWPAEPAQPQQDEQQGDGTFRLRGRSFLLTYNWDFFNKPLPDGTAAATSPKALWRCWKEWKALKKAELSVTQSTSTMERSLESSLAGRVHLHWKTNLKDALDNKTRSVFAFHGVLPNVQPTAVAAVTMPGKKPRGASFAEASNRAHFYAWAPKLGTLYKGTNYQPFKDYRVLGKWLDDLWTDGKLAHEEYRALALRVRVGYATRIRNLEQVLADEREQRVDQRMALVDKELEKLKAPPRFFQKVKDWEDSFLELDFRWKMLVLWADSASGKSTFAEGLFDNPYLLTVEEAENLDLRGFDFERHDGIVLDNVNTFGQILKWRAVLQARNAKSKGGQSATNMYSYTQYLFSVAVVVTVDLDAPDGYLVDAENADRSKWLVKNTVLVPLERGETFYDAAKKPKRKLENTFSLFAKTVKRRRQQAPEA